jgi:hypothetical protein
MTFRGLICISVILLLILSSSVTSLAAEEPTLQDITITISGEVKGIMGRKPGQTVHYHFRGINFVTDLKGDVKSKYIIDFATLPAKPLLGTNPFAVVAAFDSFSKKGDEISAAKLIEPNANRGLLTILNSPESQKVTINNYKNATGIEILFAFQLGDHLQIFYSIHRPDGPVIQADEVIKVGSSYFLRVQQPTNADDVVTNIFTALYANLHGQPGCISVTP